MRSSARRWTVVVLLAGGAAAAAPLLLRRSEVPDPPSPTAGSAPQPASTPRKQRAPLASPDTALRREPSPIRFKDRTAGSGIEGFRYYGGPSADRHMTEQNGGGVAIADLDQDRTADLFFTNGSRFDRPAGQPQTQRLFRGLGAFRYEDITTPAGLEAFDFGQGCAAGDYDNDGFTDLFVACYGKGRLWRNNGDATFTEVTEAAGLTGKAWETSAAFADLDDDGDLDLMVVNYVDWGPDEPPCYSQHEPPVKISCSPTTRPGQKDFLYRNLGDGRFEEIAEQAGVAGGESGKGLALGIADFDGDGRRDVYVANDTTPNELYLNRGEMQFSEEAVVRGAAVSADGVAGASMGVACGDYDGDGRFDLAVTNFLNQPNDVFQNLGPAGFRPANEELGVDLVSRPMLSFGILFSDFDLDGWPDLFVANGHIWDFTGLELSYPYEMTQQVLRNEEGKRFRDVSAAAGDYFSHRWLGRAAAVGDLDDDGDPDLVVCHHDAPPALLENRSERAGKGVRLTFIGVRGAREPLGACVRWRAAERELTGWIPAGGSFQASLATTLTLAAFDTAIDRVEIVWGPGRTEMWTNVPSTNLLRLVEGTGTPADARPSE